MPATIAVMRELRSQGITLLETLIVVSLLGIVAVVAIPGFRSAEPQRLELAAQTFAQAMRFARSEAIRLGRPVGFRQQNAQKRMRVYNLDTSTSPWTLIYDVYHPVSKKIYDIKLDDHPLAQADTVTNNRVFRGSCDNFSNVYFDPNGVPFCANPETVLVEQFDITLTLGGHSRVVMLDGITGRVTVQ